MVTLIAGLVFLLSIFLGYSRPRLGIYIAAALIPTYIFRIQLLGILPTNFIELVIMGLFISSLFGRRFQLPSLTLFEKIGFLLVGVGLVAGSLVAPDLTTALGIVKGWFIIPAIYGWLIWRNLLPGQLPNLFKSLALGSLPLALTAIYQIITQRFVTIDDRASGWFSSPNYLALYLVPVSILTLGLILSAKSRTDRALFGVIFAICAAAVLATQSLSGITALTVGCLILLLRGKPKSQLTMFAPAIFERISGLADLSQRSSASVRIQVWETALYLIRHHWITGTGLGSFNQLYTTTVTKIANPPLEYSILHSHNIFLETWLSLGLAGLLGALTLVVQWLQMGARANQTIIGAALFAALVAILIHGLADLPYFKNDLALLFWVIVASLYVKAPSLQHRN